MLACCLCLHFIKHAHFHTRSILALWGIAPCFQEACFPLNVHKWLDSNCLALELGQFGHCLITWYPWGIGLGRNAVLYLNKATKSLESQTWAKNVLKVMRKVIYGKVRVRVLNSWRLTGKELLRQSFKRNWWSGNFYETQRNTGKALIMAANATVTRELVSHDYKRMHGGL